LGNSFSMRAVGRGIGRVTGSHRDQAALRVVRGGLGTAYEDLGNSSEALAHWRKAHLIDPGRSSASLGVAWLLATAPDASLRNGPEAVRLAENAGTQRRTMQRCWILWLLLMPKTASSRARLATAARAAELAKAQGNQVLLTAVRARQLFYTKNKPFHGDRVPAARARPKSTRNRCARATEQRYVSDRVADALPSDALPRTLVKRNVPPTARLFPSFP